MRNEARANQLTREIGQLILHDPKLAHGTWNAFTLLLFSHNNGFYNYGFFYDIRGKARQFSVELPEHLLEELQDATLDAGYAWQACRLEIKAAGWEMSWEFEYDHPERFFPTHDLRELAQDLAPGFHGDEYWHCPLSHNVLEKLRHDSPETVEDLGVENLHCMITNSILKGMRHGLETRSDLASFALTCFEVAPNFDTHPAIRAAFLKVRNLPGSVWNVLCASVPDGAWADMSKDSFYDGRAWFSEMPSRAVEEVA